MTPGHLRRISTWWLPLIAVAGVFSPAAAFAQGTGFFAEIHLGGIPSNAPGVTSSALPAPGLGFTDFTGNPSRQVPSWYFGDGAKLANQVTAQTGDNVSIIPLDSVLTGASVGRNSGGNFGVRVGHSITRFVLVTISYDQVSSNIALTSNALAAINATNASFGPYWQALLTRPNTTNVKASSKLSLGDNVSNTNRLATLAVEIRPVTVAGFTPYVAIGGGFSLPGSAAPQLTLIGTYQFNVNNLGPNNGALVAQTDQIQVTYKTQATVVKVFGIGVERELGHHLGVRGEARGFIDANSIKLRLDTNPVTQLQAPPLNGVVRRGMNPSLQIASNPNFVSSLSLQGVNHVETSTMNGNVWSYSVGVFVRF
jgi:hypothetical protein